MPWYYFYFRSCNIGNITSLQRSVTTCTYSNSVPYIHAHLLGGGERPVWGEPGDACLLHHNASACEGKTSGLDSTILLGITLHTSTPSNNHNTTTTTYYNHHHCNKPHSNGAITVDYYVVSDQRHLGALTFPSSSNTYVRTYIIQEINGNRTPLIDAYSW